MSVTSEHDHQLELAAWIDSRLSCPYELSSRSLQLAHPCFDLVVEHHAAICLLQDSKLYGAMLALLRVQLDALVYGLWLRHVATDDDLKKYEKDRRIGFGLRVAGIEEKLGIEDGGLSYLKKEQWDIFCSFAHSGYQAVLRRVGKTHTGSVNYKTSEIITALRQSGLFAVMAAVELASISGNKTLIEETMQLAWKYGDNGL